MKNPLTSKERRGLVAVAAAALLCISLGFIFRSCSGANSYGNDKATIVIENNDGKENGSAADSISAESGINKRDKTSSKKKKRESAEKKKKKKASPSRKRKAEKTYPVRDPLSQPCD